MVWLWLAGCGSRDPVLVDSDRAVALTAAAVQPFAMLRGDLDPAKETWRLEHAPAGEWTLEYEYSDDRLLVEYSAVVEPKDGDVSWIYLGYGVGRNFVDGADGLVLVDLPAALAWGDETECDLMRTSGVDVGFVCRGRSGSRAFMATVAGVFPQGEAAPGRLLARPLAALDAWNPTATH
ncbi:MAG: hypothetical protein ABMA64_29715 [Myxococcota bacterium]